MKDVFHSYCHSYGERRAYSYSHRGVTE
jgi:hypothetical protein